MAIVWNKRITDEDEKFIIHQYVDKNNSASKILSLMGNKFKTRKTIYDVLKKHGITSKTKQDYVNMDHFYFSEIDTRYKAYVLGLMISDGYVIRNQVGIQLQEGDAAIIEKIKEEWQSDNKILTCHKKPFKGTNGNTYHPKPMRRIAVNSARFKNDLAKYGVVERKSKATIMPVLTDELQSHMLRGIVDGDGSIFFHSNGRDVNIRFVGSHYLVAQISTYLHMKLGVRHGFPRETGNISLVEWHVLEDVKKNRRVFI